MIFMTSTGEAWKRPILESYFLSTQDNPLPSSHPS